MPSETLDFKSLSSSLYSFEDICSSTKKQDGFWKSNNLSNCYDSDQGTRPNLSVQTVSNFSENSKVDVIATQHESSLFSSSLSELFSRKLGLSANNALYGHSIDTVASQCEEEMLFDSLEELEAQTIGNLLPNDDDDLLAGLTDGHNHIIKDSAGDDSDELDLFTSVGGMDLGDDDSSSSGQKNSEFLDGACNDQLQLCSASTAGEYPYGEHSSRTLFVKNTASDVDDSELEQKDCSHYLHQNNPPLKSSTSFPGLHGVINSGSMNGKRIPGAEPAMRAPSLETSFLHRVSSSVPNTIPSRVRVKSIGNRCGITEASSPRELNFGIQAVSAFDPHSLPECHDGLANSVLCNPREFTADINRATQERIDNMQFCQVNYNGHAMEFNECDFESSGNGGCLLPGHHYKWSNFYQTLGMKWPNSPSFFEGICAAPALPRLHDIPRPPSHMMSTVLSINHQHVPSAPAVNCNIWDRQHIYAGESLEASAFHPGSPGNIHFVDLTSHNIFPRFGTNYVDLQGLPKNVGLQFHNQRGMIFHGRNHMVPMISSFGTHKERAKSRRNEGGSNLVDMKQYELDIDRIKKGEDNRTTLMIKNIPNKYTSKMLLAAIDEQHKGTYDFVYLPIDFKNKCNVGYAFINMTNPSLIIPFYQVFNGKKWEKFNSEKVASLAYARIQGKAALIAHFQNSSLMNEDKRCRPILFNTEGPNAGDQVPFPVGVNIRNRPGRVRNNTMEDKLAGSPPYSGTGRLSHGGHCISKESD